MTRAVTAAAVLVVAAALVHPATPATAAGASFPAPSLAAPAGADARTVPRRVIDAFEDPSPWSAHPADGVRLAIGADAGVHGRALRLDFDFGGGGGYAVARREVSIDLPENYRFRFAVKGACLPNDLEFKLIDSTGDNVWWCNRRRFVFPARWDSLSTKKRQIAFAWGPSNAELRRVAAIEIAITAGSGGMGTVWLDDLTLEPLPPPSATPPAPRASASSSARGHAPAPALDADPASYWSSVAGDAHPWLALDLEGEREFGGLVIDWAPGRAASDYDVEISDDGGSWRTLRRVRGGNGSRDPLMLPESEARHVRIRVIGARTKRPVAIRALTIEPLTFGESPESFYQAIAKDAPRGSYPRGMSGEQVYWSVLGLDGGRNEALLGEDGALEAGKAQFSIEPFLQVGGKLVTWADVSATQRLEGGDTPVPSVTWKHGELELDISAFAIGTGVEFRAAGVPRTTLEALAPGGGAVMARYHVTNHAARPQRVTLDLALRPFQVNPPTQFLNTRGGTAPIRSLVREGRVIRVNGDLGVVSLTAPSSFGAATFDQGDIVELLRDRRLPRASRVTDAFAHASGALAYMLEVPAGGTREVDVSFPLSGRPLASPAALSESDVERLERASRDYWEARQGPVSIELPPPAEDVARTLRAQMGWILINRDGPAIQPGSRSYERSWIRDGALTSTALLRMGHPRVVREFLEWFAGHQYPGGKVPCCIDARGADPVPEHDSSGELIYAIAEYTRCTGDRTPAARLWPVVERAAAYLDSLRHERRTAEWRTPQRREFFGLLPPSISHEGYSAKPMHSYWDDLFALRGFKDAAYLAGVLELEPQRRRWAAVRDEFARDLQASITAAAARHHIDYVPGCADLGDFDATSTTIALDPVQAGAAVPRPALQRTFEKYWEFFRARRDGRDSWDAYTPYEMRNIGAFVRLGWRERADSLLTWFMQYRRPPGWAQWAEVVGRDERAPRFIGDMPHTWVGSDFVRSVLDMLAYERESDSTLVLCAGVPLAWARAESGIAVRGLVTPHGPLSYTLHAAADSTTVRIDGGVRVPRGGIVVRAPIQGAVRRARVNGAPAAVGRDGEVRVKRVPATVVLMP